MRELGAGTEVHLGEGVGDGRPSRPAQVGLDQRGAGSGPRHDDDAGMRPARLAGGHSDEDDLDRVLDDRPRWKVDEHAVDSGRVVHGANGMGVAAGRPQPRLLQASVEPVQGTTQRLDEDPGGKRPVGGGQCGHDQPVHHHDLRPAQVRAYEITHRDRRPAVGSAPGSALGGRTQGDGESRVDRGVAPVLVLGAREAVILDPRGCSPARRPQPSRIRGPPGLRRLVEDLRGQLRGRARR